MSFCHHYPEDRDSAFHRNTGTCILNYTTSLSSTQLYPFQIPTKCEITVFWEVEFDELRSLLKMLSALGERTK
jgi:hypothetical protein